MYFLQYAELFSVIVLNILSSWLFKLHIVMLIMLDYYTPISIDSQPPSIEEKASLWKIK